MTKVKIYGAGSIGNHLAHACHRNGWDVSVVDTDLQALKRMREEIYPFRYGFWDKEIKLYEARKDPEGFFDVVMVGTPPDVRAGVALRALDRNCPRLMLLEKPLCSVENIPAILKLRQIAAFRKVMLVGGYNHSLSKGVEYFAELLSGGAIGEVETIDVEWREHWGGIFSAHPWLSGPEDSYLGYVTRGGGALGEHSHAVHLYLYLAQLSGLGDPEEVSAFMDFGSELSYDKIASLNIRTNKGRQGRVVQDVISKPTLKRARAQGEKGFIEWNCGPDLDYVRGGIEEPGYGDFNEWFPKKRPDEFFAEIKHLDALLKGRIPIKKSPIFIESGIGVMKIIKAAHLSNLSGRSVYL